MASVIILSPLETEKTDQIASFFSCVLTEIRIASYIKKNVLQAGRFTSCCIIDIYDLIGCLWFLAHVQ